MTLIKKTYDIAPSIIIHQNCIGPFITEIDEWIQHDHTIPIFMKNTIFPQW